MVRLSRTYCMDVAPYATMSLPEFYDFLKNIPYRADPRGTELVKRPFYTLNRIGKGGDCDCKTIVMLAWARLNKIPARIVTASKNKKKGLHHVYPELYYMGNWCVVDATYPRNTLGRQLFREARRRVFSVE